MLCHANASTHVPWSTLPRPHNTSLIRIVAVSSTSVSSTSTGGWWCGSGRCCCCWWWFIWFMVVIVDDGDGDGIMDDDGVGRGWSTIVLVPQNTAATAVLQLRLVVVVLMLNGVWYIMWDMFPRRCTGSINECFSSHPKKGNLQRWSTERWKSIYSSVE